MPETDELDLLLADPEVAALLEAGTQVRDALEQIVALRALTDLAEARTTVLRKFLKVERARIEAETGGAMNVPVKGLGRVYVTQPGERLVVTDERAWGEWLRATYPDRTEVRPVANTARLLTMCRTDPELETRLREAAVIEDEVIADAKLHAEILEGSGRTTAGGLVDPATGQVLAAIAQRTGQPILTVKAEPRAIERAQRALLAGGIPVIAPKPALTP